MHLSRVLVLDYCKLSEKLKTFGGITLRAEICQNIFLVFYSYLINNEFGSSLKATFPS